MHHKLNLHLRFLRCLAVIEHHFLWKFGGLVVDIVKISKMSTPSRQYTLSLVKMAFHSAFIVARISNGILDYARNMQVLQLACYLLWSVSSILMHLIFQFKSKSKTTISNKKRSAVGPEFQSPKNFGVQDKIECPRALCNYLFCIDSNGYKLHSLFMWKAKGVFLLYRQQHRITYMHTHTPVACKRVPS